MRQLALEYIIALSSASEDIRKILFELNAIPIVTRGSELAMDEPGSTLADLCAVSLYSLSSFELSLLPTNATLLDRYHLGPDAIGNRLIGLVLAKHIRADSCSFDFKTFQPSTESIFDIVCDSCPNCGQAVEADWELDACRELLARLAVFIRFVISCSYRE